MTLNIKKILKQLDVLFLSQEDNTNKKIENILNIFFKSTIKSDFIKNAIEHYNHSKPAVIIVDIDLNNENGIDFIKEVRKKNKIIPIIIITKNRELNNLLEAIKLNLIDYLLEPLDVSKFIFCINQSAKQILNSSEIITTVKNDVKYNYLDKTILIKKEKHNLTKNETRLIELFLSNKNKFIGKEEIKKHIWTNKEISESAFKSLINRLNKKLEENTINNSFGIGYGIFD